MESLDYFWMRRATYYGMGHDNSDNLNDSNVIVVENNDTIVQDACDYLKYNLKGVMRYPGKSYAIAILYAHWLEQLGVGALISNLSLPDLLAGDDPHFTPFSFENDSHKLYYEIFEKVNYNLPDLHNNDSYYKLEYLMMTRDYFLKEFMLNPIQRELMPFEPEWPLEFRFNEGIRDHALFEEYIKSLYTVWLSDTEDKFYVYVNAGGVVRLEPFYEREERFIVGPDGFQPDN